MSEFLSVDLARAAYRGRVSQLNALCKQAVGPIRFDINELIKARAGTGYCDYHIARMRDYMIEATQCYEYQYMATERAMLLGPATDFAITVMLDELNAAGYDASVKDNAIHIDWRADAHSDSN